jgi:hypothetical protein
MAKSHDAKKSTKKAPLKTADQKRADKRAKKNKITFLPPTRNT